MEYEISDLGQTLVPVFDTLVGWSEARLPQVAAARRAYDAAREEEEAWAEG